MESTSKRRRVDLVDRVDPWSISEAPDPLPYSPDDNYFQLPESHVEGFRLFIDMRLLFCRVEFHSLFAFLNTALNERRVELPIDRNPYTLGWILGSPGTGKTIAVLAFLWTLSREMWAFTWLNIRAGKLCCVQVDGRHKRTLVSRAQGKELDNLLFTFLGQVQKDKQHVVCIDGFTADCTALLWLCTSWLEEDYGTHRLVVVCSMSHRDKNSEVEDAIMHSKEFFLNSWTKEQYVEAVKDDTFFDNAKPNLDATPQGEDISREELVESKFYFAGGSCRYMFEFPTLTVTESIDRALDTAPDILPYLEGTIGIRGNKVVNRLLNCYQSRGSITTAIVSRYAATQLAVKRGAPLIDRLAQCLREQLNPAMDGWLFEMRFFSRIRRVGVTVHGDGKVLATLPQAFVERVDTSSIQSIRDDAVWWKPQRWNQGGYDAVFVDKSKYTVLFVQVTVASKHTFKIDHFYRLLSQLKEHMVISVMEIFFLSPKGIEPKISQVSGHGLLDPFDGWQKGREKDAVKKGWVDFSSEL